VSERYLVELCPCCCTFWLYVWCHFTVWQQLLFVSTAFCVSPEPQLILTVFLQ
jgi:hypothetical protein